MDTKKKKTTQRFVPEFLVRCQMRGKERMIHRSVFAQVNFESYDNFCLTLIRWKVVECIYALHFTHQLIIIFSFSFYLYFIGCNLQNEIKIVNILDLLTLF